MSHVQGNMYQIWYKNTNLYKKFCINHEYDASLQSHNQLFISLKSIKNLRKNSLKQSIKNNIQQTTDQKD